MPLSVKSLFFLLLALSGTFAFGQRELEKGSNLFSRATIHLNNQEFDSALIKYSKASAIFESEDLEIQKLHALIKVAEVLNRLEKYDAGLSVSKKIQPNIPPDRFML